MSKLSLNVVVDSVVYDYIDDYLRDRLTRDTTAGESEWVDGCTHLAIKNKDRIVGIISIKEQDNDKAIIHPKIKKGHMIYAKRACILAKQYAEHIMNKKEIYAIIPAKFKANCRMAESCGLKLLGEDKNAVSINDESMSVLTYGVEL